jgi:hypothetical protein
VARGWIWDVVENRQVDKKIKLSLNYAVLRESTRMDENPGGSTGLGKLEGYGSV